MGVGSEIEVKVPLAGKSIALEALPGQDPDTRYGVVWDACEQPDDGLGYVVEFCGPRTCRILAWLASSGMVNECDRPISFVLPGIPVVAALRPEEGSQDGTVRARVHGSDELATVAGFHDSFPSQVVFDPLPGKAVAGILSDEELRATVGPYAGRRLSWRTLMAVSYLAFYLLPRLGAHSGELTGTIADVLASFTGQPLPDAVEGLAFRVLAADNGSGDEVSGFERYAARMLEQAGMAELRSIAARRRIGIARLSTTGMFWIRMGDDVEPEERETLLAMEACLNRLALVERSLEDAGASTALAACREGACAAEEQRALARVADRARTLMEACEDENPYSTYIPAQPRRGGEWDVRTRFIHALETASVPFRLEYRFDCHAELGILHVAFGLPRASRFPTSRWSGAVARWENREGERPAFAACYALRAATLVAAAAFGTGMGMRQVLVEGRDGGVDGAPLLALCFERMSFLSRTLPRIDLGAVARAGEHGPCTGADVRELLDLLAPMEAHVNFDDTVGLVPVEPLDAGLPQARLPLSADDRYLPTELAHLLHADRVRDLDIEAGTDLRELDLVQTAIEDAADSPLLAIARLEDIVARSPIDGLEAPDDVVAAAEAALRGAPESPGYLEADGEGGSRPVRLAYFPNLIARCMVDLVSHREDEAFRTVPAHAYLSRAALARLYLEDGDKQAAAARATECAALAPTSPVSLMETAQLELAAGRPHKAAGLLKDALRVCPRQQAATALYAHLAGALWASGQAAEAMACFVMMRRFNTGETQFDQMIRQTLKQAGLESLPTLEEAQAIMRAAGIPIAPTDEARAIMMMAAVGFTDARMFELAWPLVGVIGFDVGNDVLAILGEQLHTGV